MSKNVSSIIQSALSDAAYQHGMNSCEPSLEVQDYRCFLAHIVSDVLTPGQLWDFVLKDESGVRELLEDHGDYDELIGRMMNESEDFASVANVKQALSVLREDDEITLANPTSTSSYDHAFTGRLVSVEEDSELFQVMDMDDNVFDVSWAEIVHVSRA